MISEDSETLFEAQLEPIATRHTVATPVMEILVPNNALDAFVVVIGRRILTSQDILGVKDIELLKCS